MIHTNAHIPVTIETFDEIKQKFKAIGYGHVIASDSNELNMNGITLTKQSDSDNYVWYKGYLITEEQREQLENMI